MLLLSLRTDKKIRVVNFDDSASRNHTELQTRMIARLARLAYRRREYYRPKARFPLPELTARVNGPS